MSEVLEEGEKKLSQCSTKGRELSQLRREVAPGHLSLNHTFVLRRLKPPSPLPAHFPSFQVGFRKCGKSERMCFPNLSQRPQNLQPKLLILRDAYWLKCTFTHMSSSKLADLAK